MTSDRTLTGVIDVRRDLKLTEADRIAVEFSTIPFADHEARTLALAYFRLRGALDQAEQARDTEHESLVLTSNALQDAEDQIDRLRVEVADLKKRLGYPGFAR